MTIDEVEMNIQSYKNFLIVKRLSFFWRQSIIDNVFMIDCINNERTWKPQVYMPFTNRDKTMYKLITDVAQELTKNVSLDIVYGFIRSTYAQ